MRWYRVFDKQRGVYFGTGYNSTSMKELIKDFQNYIMYENESVKTYMINTWAKIEDWLQGIKLEKSDKPFEEYGS